MFTGFWTRFLEIVTAKWFTDFLDQLWAALQGPTGT